MDFYRPIAAFKNIWWFIIVNLLWGSLVSLYFNSNAFDNWQSFVYGSLFGFSISASYVYGFILIWIELDKKYNWIHQTGKRVFYGILFGELYATLSYALLAFIFGYLISRGQMDGGYRAIEGGLKYPAINFLPSVLIVCAVAFFKNWSSSVRNQEQLKSEMVRYKFEALQNQLNPHFLFNSFNVLNNLVFDDKKLAVRFIDQLQEIYDYVLESKEKNLVTLEEELAFVESYAFLLNMRFEEKLQIDVKVQSSNDQMIAPMVIQLLIENAVKHNVITRQQPLSILILEEDNQLIVSNNIQLKKTIEKSTKTGLSNIKERYSMILERLVTIEQTEGQFRVSIPIIRKEVQDVD